MDLKIISWNIRGIIRKEKRRAVNGLFQKFRPNFVLIQETKLEVFSVFEIRRLWSSSVLDYALSPSIGSASGLLSMWDTGYFQVDDKIIRPRFIVLIGCIKHKNFTCGILNVYGPTVEAEKGDFLGDLLALIRQKQIPWCLAGDFNLFLDPCEKIGRSLILSSIAIFRTFIFEASLIDLPLIGGKFLLSSDFEEAFPNIVQKLLNKSLSDHNAILLCEEVINWGPKPFRVFNFWCNENGYDDTVFSAIRGLKLKKPRIKIGGLLKGTKSALKSWVVETNQKNNGLTVVQMEQEITDLETKIQLGLASDDTFSALYNLRTKLWSVYRKEESANRRRKNAIISLKCEGVRISESSLVKKHVKDHFCSVYNEQNNLEVADMKLDFKKLNSVQVGLIEFCFSEEEVWLALSSADSNRAPGPDGFNMGFFKKFWPVLKDDIMILSKVLARRLRLVMGELIGETEFAFLPGRQILDCVLVANEAIDIISKAGSKGVAFKIDFQKAYDTVSWDFLIRILHECGFGEKWCNWMFRCISSVSISILVIGSPTEAFSISRGLRQGCSLSPLLFNFVGEALNLMLNKAVRLSLFSGFRMGRSEGAVDISHIQFADDLLIFCGGQERQVRNVKRVLRVFELASGLKLNLKKSKVFGINLSEDSLKNWAVGVGCAWGSFPIEYFGTAIGMPVTVANHLNSLMASFLWGDDNEKSRIHWTQVCMSLLCGGLGVANLEIMNRSLLGKWFWRFGNEASSLWKRVIIAKIPRTSTTLLPYKVPHRSTSWVWKELDESRILVAKEPLGGVGRYIFALISLIESSLDGMN
ncbi:hypothetical protein GQ457_10G009840 [Hibiscus cannabinus]